MAFELNAQREEKVVTPESPSRLPARVDDALHYMQNQNSDDNEDFTLTEEEEQRLLKKIDWMLMPLMAVVYLLQYLDKTILNYARVMGLAADTGTSASQFSYLATAFYVGYLVCEIPHGYLLQRLPLAKYLGINGKSSHPSIAAEETYQNLNTDCSEVILWGICVTLNCSSTNYASLLVLRCLLGCFEAVVSPSLILVTAMWYKKSEQPFRVGIWFGMSGAAIVIGALASFGFHNYEGRFFKSWQIMFLVCGLVTIFVGLLVLLFLPDNPMCSKLSKREKLQAIERVRPNKTGIENKSFDRAQMKEALRDPHVWLISLLMIAASEINGGLSNYQASIIQSFGFTSKQSALLSIPSGILAVIACTGGTWIAGRSNQRLLTLICLFPLGIAGAAFMALLPSSAKVGRMVGNYLTNMIPTTPLVYAISAANFSGHTKKITVNAVILISFSLGNIIGPLTFTGDTAPTFTPAKITMMVCFSTAMCLAFALRCTLRRENQKRDRLGEQNYLKDSEFMNLTDRQNRGFRYSL